MTNEIGKLAGAIEELAKLGQKGIDSGEKAARYLTKYFDAGFAALGGAFGDSAQGFRVRNWIRVMQKTDAMLKAAGIEENFQRIQERNAIPLIEAVSLESDESLQDLWASYLRRALDPASPPGTLNRQFINIIRNLEPSDRDVLDALLGLDLDTPSILPRWIEMGTLSKRPEHEVLETLYRFDANSLLTLDNDMGMKWAPDDAVICNVIVKTPTAYFRVSPLLISFRQATGGAIAQNSPN